MLRKTLTGLLTGAAIALAAGPAAAQELTIFWAEWDPANYLQELVNEYTAETGVQITVETTPWSDFQTKTFTEFNAQGRRLRHGRRRLPVARRRFDAGAITSS
jgi:multiple sugar transport system substrate-binding protein